MIHPSTLKHWKLIRSHMDEESAMIFDERIAIQRESLNQDPAAEPDLQQVAVALAQVREQRREAL